MKRLPRLSRKQRIVRNFLLVGLLVLVGWGAQDFQAPTAACALQWQLESYGIEHAEILYDAAEEDGKARRVVLRSGDFYGVTTVQKDGVWGYFATNLYLKEAEEPVTFFTAQGYTQGRKDLMYYAAADIPGAVRAVCAVRLQGKSSVSIGVEDEEKASADYDWDEVYRSEAADTGKGIWAFRLEHKYPSDPSAPYSAQARQAAERSMFQNFGSAFRGSMDPDFSCSMQIRFLDGEGKELAAYEKTLKKT